jgi:HK97 family phage major capsid protein
MDVKMRLSDNERQQNARGMYGMSQRAGLDANTAGNGLNTIFTEYVSLIELLRNKMMVRALGATVLSGLSETIAFPKQASAGTATWVADNPGADVADSNLTFAQITMTPKLLQSSTSFSRKLLLQSSVDVEALVRNDLMQIVARAIDLAAIAGTGAANQPKGILNQVGIGSVATGGTALTYASFVLQETQVAAANADIGTMAYLTTAGMRGKLKQVAKLANTLALPVWNDGEVNGYRAEVSNQMPIVGSAPALHSCLFGVWNQLLIGEWGALEVIVDPYRLKKQGMIEVTTFDTCDVNVRHPESFSAITDANPLL